MSDEMTHAAKRANKTAEAELKSAADGREAQRSALKRQIAALTNAGDKAGLEQAVELLRRLDAPEAAVAAPVETAAAVAPIRRGRRS